MHPLQYEFLACDAAACPRQVRKCEKQLRVYLLEMIEKTRKPVGWTRQGSNLEPPGLDQLISDFIDASKEAWMQEARLH